MIEEQQEEVVPQIKVQPKVPISMSENREEVRSRASSHNETMELASRISSKAAKQTPAELSRHETSMTEIKVVEDVNRRERVAEGLRRIEKVVWKKRMHYRFSAFYNLRLHESLQRS